MLKLVLSLALAVGAVPVDPDRFDPTGVWLFHTNAQIDGAPVCSELWAFDADGGLRIESGAERVEAVYRVETDRDGTWIVRRTLRTNGAADCMGHRNPEPSTDEARTYVVPMNDGRVMTCPPPGRTEDGVPIVSDCYGWMVPADQAG